MVMITAGVEVARVASIVSIGLLSVEGRQRRSQAGKPEPTNPLMIRTKNGNFGAHPQLNNGDERGPGRVA
jgi:hypothetical protein